MVTTIHALKRRYPKQWLAIKVTKRGPHQEPIAGELVLHATSHRALHRRLKDPYIYETYAGPTPKQAVLF